MLHSWLLEDSSAVACVPDFANPAVANAPAIAGGPAVAGFSVLLLTSLLFLSGFHASYHCSRPCACFTRKSMYSRQPIVALIFIPSCVFMCVPVSLYKNADDQ